MFPSQAKSSRARDQAIELITSSCSVRVVVLIDVCQLAARRGNDDVESAKFIDGLRLSVLRILAQLSVSCPGGSYVEWATRFFDSRYHGIGKTPSELKARLRSRKAAQGTRGFTCLTQKSFQAFGDACLAVACGMQGDPLACDHELALKRWSNWQKKASQNRAAQQAGSDAQTHRIDQHTDRGGFNVSSESNTGAEPKVASAGIAGAEDGSRRMYDQHDMSRHEVVVRSMLEVLQEFGEVGESDRTDTQRLVMILHTACPQSDQDVEGFVRRGNFSLPATTIPEQPDEKAKAVLALLDAGLGKAVRRCNSYGVSLLWQDRPPGGDTENQMGDVTTCSEQCNTVLTQCLSAAGGAEILRWGRAVESSMLLPASVALRGKVCRRVGGESTSVAGALMPKSEESTRRHSTRVAVALGRRGAVDAYLSITRLSPSSASDAQQVPSVKDDSRPSPKNIETSSSRTPWRLMGTLLVGDVWPSCLAGQEWGSTVVLSMEGDLGAELWHNLLRCLSVKRLAALITLPNHVFEDTDCAGSQEGVDERRGDTTDAMAVALIMPVSAECAIGWRLEELSNKPTTEGRPIREIQECASMSRTVAPITYAQNTDDRNAARPVAGLLHAEEKPLKSIAESKVILGMRGSEVGRAMHEARLERKRRRQARCVPGVDVRATRRLYDSTVVANRRRDIGRSAGSISPRGSLSQRFAEEEASEERSSYCMRQWQFEGTSDTSQTSGTPHSLRLLDSTPGLGGDDERVASSGPSLGPRRALDQALEDASLRSSFPTHEMECSSTPGSKENRRSSEVLANHRSLADSLCRTDFRGEENQLSPAVGEKHPALDPGEWLRNGSSNELPSSFLSDPALISLPGAPLPSGIIALAARCTRNNEAVAPADLAPVNAVAISSGNRSGLRRLDCSEQKDREAQPVSSRERFIEAVRAAERRMHRVDLEFPTKSEVSDAIQGITCAQGGSQGIQIGAVEMCKTNSAESTDVILGKAGETSAFPDNSHSKLAESSEPQDRISTGVAGLRRQYLEVVEGCQRSPVEFVIRAVPEAVRDLAEGYTDSDVTDAPTSTPEDRHARATALILAAIVDGLTASPDDLSGKHRANRANRAAVPPEQATGAEAGARVTTPAMQKVRDFQLQALLFCQLHILAMDLADTPESTAAFAALARSGTGSSNEEGDRSGKSKKGKDKKGKKGKRKKKARGGGCSDRDSAPVRPADPLPDARRARLESYLQPISTMLDACTVMRAPPPSSDIDNNGNRTSLGGGSDRGSGGGSTTNGFHPRAYDGTLADFMELALVEHFASKLPRTLLALFDDFERDPPDSLTALAKASLNTSQIATKNVDVPAEVLEVSASTTGKLPAVEKAQSMEKVATSSRPASDSAGGSSKTSVTAGILLSDRGSMSHNHFAMSGVISGFRKVKMQASSSASVGPGKSVVDRKECSTNGRDAAKAVDKRGGWRVSSGGGVSNSGSRTRPPRDARKVAGHKKTSSPSSNRKISSAVQATRHSPRLKRPRSEDDAPEEDETITLTPSASRRRRRPTAPTSPVVGTGNRTRAHVTATPSPSRKGSRGGAQRGRSSVLVGETPQKGTGAESPRSKWRNGNQPMECLGEVQSQSNSAAALGGGLRSPGKRSLPASPGALMASSPATSPRSRRRVMDSPVVEPQSAGHGRELGSPSSWRAASAASRLFVAESPGVGAEPVTGGRSGLSGAYFDRDVSGISRQLVTENPSPVSRRRPVVPDTPS